MKIRSIVAATVVSLVPAAFVVASAQAATLTPTAACYAVPVLGVGTVTLSATGLTPGDEVEILNGSTTDVFGQLGPVSLLSETTVGASGTASFSSPTDVVSTAPAVGKTVVTITDETTGAVGLAHATIEVAAATFTIGGSGVIQATKVVPWVASGLPGVTTVYAHMIQPDTHKVFTVKLGTATGACGLLHVSKQALPVVESQHKKGTWKIQLDGKSAYHASTSPQLEREFALQ